MKFCCLILKVRRYFVFLTESVKLLVPLADHSTFLLQSRKNVLISQKLAFCGVAVLTSLWSDQSLIDFFFFTSVKRFF